MDIPEDLIYEGQFTIRTYEIDPSKKSTVAALINLMQEAAMQNVINLKYSVWDMEELNISWVLMRKNLKILRLPLLGETIRIKTYPAGSDKIFTYRDYHVYSKDNKLIAQSASTWLLMNTIERKIAKIPKNIRLKGEYDVSNCLKHAKNKLPSINRVDFQKNFIVNWHDLDFNEHLSNIRYMQWIFETVDYYIENKGKLEELDIVYKLECRWKDTVQVNTQKINNHLYLHKLLRLSDNALIAQAQTRWEVYL